MASDHDEEHAQWRRTKQAAAIGLIGGFVGIVVGLTSIVRQRPGDGGPVVMIPGVTALATGALGAVFALLFLAGWRRPVAVLGLLGAAALHMASNPLLGIPGGLLLLLSAVLVLTAIEEASVVRPRSPGAEEPPAQWHTAVQQAAAELDGVKTAGPQGE